MPDPAHFDVYRAFRDTAFAFADQHRKDGGMELLAAKMGLSAGVLYNKAAAADEGAHHKPTLGQGVQIQVITQDTRIVQTMAAVVGGVFTPVSELSCVSDKELLEIISNWMSQQGKFFEEMNAALADGQVDVVEHGRLRGRAQFILAAILELVARLEQMRPTIKKP